MNIGIQVAGALKEEMLKGDVDFEDWPTGHLFYALLMRPGFSFNSSRHMYKKNIITTVGGITYAASGNTKTITVSAGSSDLADDGFTVGNYLTINAPGADNHGETFEITNVDGLTMKVKAISGGNELVTEDPTPVTGATFTTNDEHDEDVGGYQYGGVTVTFTISGTTLSLDTVDLTNDGAPFYDEIDDSPGFIVFDDSNANDVIVCYASFNDWIVAI